ncbi:MAG: DUF4080 domain-containing protein [Deltaproteobacteria bacterium]|nr:DUF4080 domain-containing protein [Deltaproteobacteria bacterium]
MKYALLGFNCRFTHSCLSLFYLRQELVKNMPDADICISQYTINDPYYATLTQIGTLKAHIYFFSVYIWNEDIITRIIHDLHVLQPLAVFILGGPQASALAAEELPANCTIVWGEIEDIDPAFYRDLRHGALASHYKGGRSASFASPFIAEDFNGQLANRHIYYESSRGCPYSCSYCISSIEPGIRNKNLRQVREELKAIQDHNPKTIRFVDRTFNASDQRALAIWKFLTDEPGNTSFHFEISPDLFTEEMFSFLESIPPGLFQFEIGIQSTHDKTLAAINRKHRGEASLENIRRLVKLDTIHLHIDLILGLPHETFESFGQSFTDVFATCPHYIQMGLLKVLPHTRLSEQVKEFSILHCRRPPYEVLSTGWLSHGELTELFWLGECVEAFYNNRFFRSFFAFIQKSGQDSFQLFLNLLQACRKKNFFGRAKTQLLMSEILLDFTSHASNSLLMKEILIFDWLRSGHRFLPEHLDPMTSKELKSRLWLEMPENFLPFYTNTSRSNFFKQAIFVEFSGELLKELGFTDGNDGVLCFLNERENSVMRLNKVFFVQGSG